MATRPAPDEALLARLPHRLDLRAQVRLLSGQDFWTTPPEPAVGLRSLVTSDGPAGVRGTDWDDREPSVSLPSPSAWAATWDPDLVARAATVLASEARRQGVDVVLGPTVNLHRSPVGGRHFECFSEDPLLTAVVARAYVRGLQDAGVGASVKHYVANDSETERFTLTVVLDERTLREVYLAPFEAAVTDAGAWLVMAAYNAVATAEPGDPGEPGPTMTENPLLRSPLREEWGFDGVVVSDWFAVRSTAQSAAAGTDLAMPGPGTPWGDALVAAVEAGDVPASAVSDAVLRLLRLAWRVGALDDGPAPAPVPRVDARAVARELAAAGAVLLRDEPAGTGGGSPDQSSAGAPPPLLPLDRGSLRRVAVLGAHAAEPRAQGGGSATVFPAHVVSPLEGLRAALGERVEVVHAVGAPLPDGVRPAPPELLRPDDDPPDGSGSPGSGDADEAAVAVRWLDDDGREVHAERRAGGLLSWVGLASRPADATSLQATCRVRADAAGTWRVGVRTLGRVRLDVDGETVVDDDVAPEVDDLAAFLFPPERAVQRDLAQGEEVALRVRHEVPGDSPAVSLTIGVERPSPGPRAAREEAAALARDADVAVVVVGTTEKIESEGVDRATLALPEGQDELVRAVVAANPRTVVVVNAGAPVVMPWREEVPALLLTWFPGQEGGAALADVLLGDVEPGGRLPTTWPAREEDAPVRDTAPQGGLLRYDEGLHVGHRGWLRRAQDEGGPEPAYWFGHGLGWTTWEVAGVHAPREWPQDTDEIVVEVRLRNVGSRAGATAVGLYASRSGGDVERPVRWLVGTGRVRAGAGEEVSVDVPVERRTVRHWSTTEQRWATEPGELTLHASLSADTRGGPSCTVVLA